MHNHGKYLELASDRGRKQNTFPRRGTNKIHATSGAGDATERSSRGGENMTDYDRVRAGRAIWAWRLHRMGEFPCNAEIVAVRGTSTEELGTARQAVRDMANVDGTPIEWLSHETVTPVSDDEAEVAKRARQDALLHGMEEEELPPKLRKDD